VKEIRLLSTIFLDSNGTFVQAPNTELNKMVIYSIAWLSMARLISSSGTVYPKSSPQSSSCSLSYDRHIENADDTKNRCRNLSHSMSAILRLFHSWRLCVTRCWNSLKKEGEIISPCLMSLSLVRPSTLYYDVLAFTRFGWLDFPEQDKMTLKADIKYKSNWQQGGLKSKIYLSHLNKI
jgi:hypothetical protein